MHLWQVDTSRVASGGQHGGSHTRSIHMHGRLTLELHDVKKDCLIHRIKAAAASVAPFVDILADHKAGSTAGIAAHLTSHLVSLPFGQE